jgi:hypothetical protein
MKSEVAIKLTWSKIMAFCILGCAVYLDHRGGGATAFMFALPFIAALIIGKQYFDKNKLETP